MSAVAAPAAVSTPEVAPAVTPEVVPGKAEATTPATPATKAPEVPSKHKVGAREYTVAELEAALQTQSTIADAMKQLAQRESELGQREGAFKSGDKAKIMEALLKAGVPRDQLADMAAEILTREIEEESMTPEQKELAALRAEKAESDRQRAEKAEAEKQKAVEEQTAKLTQAYESQFVEAMTTHGLPRTPQVMIQLTQMVMDGLEAGYEVQPAEAALVLRAQLVEANRPMYEGMSVEQLREALGPKVVDALAKARTAELQGAVNRAPDSPAARKANRPAAPSGAPKSLDELIAAKLAAPRRRS